MVATTNLQMPLLAASQAQKHVTLNESLLKLDGLAQLSALSYSVAAQPASPADGDLYILPPGKTGADWGGAANHAIAHYYDGVWHFYAPREGWMAYDRASETAYVFDGSAWSRLAVRAGVRPAFLAYRTSTLANMTGDGAAVFDVVLDAVRFDNGGDFNTATGVFTAPVDGRYLFAGTLQLADLATDTFERAEVYLATSNATILGTQSSATIYASTTTLALFVLAVADMDAGDTAKLRAFVSGGTKTVDIVGTVASGGTLITHLSGALVA